MSFKVKALAMACASFTTLGLVGCAGEDGTSLFDQVVSMTYESSTVSQGFGVSAAEIVTFDHKNKRVMAVNAASGQLDVFETTDLSALYSLTPESVDLGQMLVDNGKVSLTSLVGAANSVSLSDKYVAVAVEANPKTDAGWIVFLKLSDLSYVNAVQVGALPDMVTFTPDYAQVVVANEGEPNEGYTIDPEGSVSIIKMSDFSVSTATFTAFNENAVDSRFDELPAEKMLLDGYSATNTGNKASIAQSFEPEYITVSEDSKTAYVTLQENNAIAVVDLATAEVTKIIGLGFKDHSIPGNELDASQKDGVNIKNWPVMGMYMPDTITSMTYNGKTYLLTANEGDDRQDWLDGVTDQTSCEAAGYLFADDGDGERCMDAVNQKDFSGAFTLVNSEVNPFIVDADGDAVRYGFGEDNQLRRLKFSYHTTKAMNGGTDFEKLYAYGARSFSIWDAETGERVFDSGSEMERVTANIYGEAFNASNDDQAGDDRSDNKGPEPEAIAVGKINGHTYAFVGMERIGGVFMYDVSNPFAPSFVQYVNNRDMTVDIEDAGDLGPESIKFVSASESPSGKPFILVGNEVSGTVAAYTLDVSVLK